MASLRTAAHQHLQTALSALPALHWATQALDNTDAAWLPSLCELQP